MLIPISVSAQWYQQSPLPPANKSILSLSFISKTTGWAVGNLGMILKTTNGVTSWIAQISPYNDSLNSVSFTSATTGWIATSKGRVLSTSDGGNTWTAKMVDSTVIINSLCFTSATTGWLVGSGGAIYKTTDGGSSWAPQTSGTSYTLYAVDFVSSTVGWAVGFGRTILKTTDGGTTWVTQTTSTSNYLYAVSFTSETLGWAVGDAGTILNTTDGGSTWTGQYSGSAQDFHGLSFISATTGWICGNNDGVHKTTDGGATWTKMTNSMVGDYSALFFFNSTLGWIGGEYGYVASTSDGGTTWTKLSNGATQNLTSVSFKSVLKGCAVGEAGRVLRTTDGGSTWNVQVLDSNLTLESVCFATVDSGWIAGTSGFISRTIDTGKTWITQSSGTSNDLNSIHFISSRLGWAAGNNGTILATTDGGNTWNLQPTGITNNLLSVFFASSSVGYACGGNQNGMLKTTNGGAYWFALTNYYGARNMYFATPDIGWVLGGNYTGLVKTLDGGNNWIYESLNDTYSFNGINFFSPADGWAVGPYGNLLYTTNGGNSWPALSSSSDRYPITWNKLQAVSSVSPTAAWAVGDGGTILRSSVISPNWIAITLPAGSEQWVTGTTQPIKWNSKGVTNVKIEYSIDAGNTWITIVNSAPASTGSYSWKVTGPASTNCMIRITDAADPADIALSGGQFTILPSPMVKLVSPVGGESWQVGTRHAISWTDSSVVTVKLEYSTNGGSSWSTVIAATPAVADSFIWVVPNTVSANCRVRISDTSNTAVSNASASSFSITASASVVLTLVSPNGGENFEAGTQKAITWVSAGITNVSINYSTDDGSSWKVIITSTSASTGSYTWTVPNVPSSWCFVKISDATNPTTTSISASQFNIFSRSLSLTSPVGGELWRTGSVQNITWSQGNIDSVHIELTTDNGKTWSNVIAKLPGAVSSYPWLVPNTTSTLCKIRISNLANTAIRDTSDSTFTIYHPAITLLSPNGGESWVEGTSHTVTWNSNNVTNVNLEYSADKGVTWTSIATKITATTGSYAWTLPYLVSKNCKVRISEDGNSVLWDTSATTFSITKAILYSSDTLAFGSTYVYNPNTQNLTITNQGSDTYYLSLSINNSAFTLVSTSVGIPANTGQTVAITFLPTTAGSQTGKLAIQYYSPGFGSNVTDTIILSGTGKAITYPTQVALSKTFSFNYTGNPSDYRMVSVPGKFSSTLDQVFSGTRGQDWDAYKDNGSSSNYLVEFKDSSKFAFSPGVGFWVLSKNSAALSQSVSSADVLTNYSYAIPLHSGWNIISNPFEKTVQWSKIVYTNLADTTVLLYAWNGSWTTASQIIPYQGYYFYNQYGLSTLKIPYDPDGGLSKVDNAAPAYYLSPEHIAMTLSGNGKTYSKVAASFDSRATTDYNKLDYMAPAGDFEEAGIRLIHSFTNAVWDQYFVECRPEIGNGQMFDMKASNTTGKDITLQINEIAGLPDDQQVYLVDKRLCKLIDLRANNKVILSGMHKESEYALLVGPSSYIQAEREALLPKTFALLQNYPNPFNPTTIISYQLPVSGKVLLKVYDILGKEVKTLIDENQDAGIHEVVFNGSNMSSGVYFYRLQAGNYKSVKKLMLIK
jgi:photosystem II stability/assembly factor-like uncharacterized protein